MQKRIPWIVVALVALGLAVAYASVTARLTGKLVLPLDDAYGYLRGGFANSPSLSWSALLAVVGVFVNGPALVTAVFWIAALLYAVTVANVFSIARALAGPLAGVLATVAALAIAPFAFSSLSGLDTALVAALWTTALRFRSEETPSLALAVTVVALGLARHEAIIVVGMIVVAGVWKTTSWRGFAAWLALIVPAIAWCVLSRARVEHVLDLEPLRGEGAPLAIGFAIVWLIGLAWMLWRRTGLLVALTPIAYLLLGTAAALPVFAITVGCAVAPIVERPRVRLAVAIVAVLGLVGLAVLPLRASLQTFAQDAADLDRRVTPFRARFADATVIGAHDPNAIAFHSGVRTVGLDGIDPLEGPGARYERLERLAPDARPSHFISSTQALGFDELFGEARAFGSRGLRWTRGELQWIEARWDHVDTGERPLTSRRGWHVVDRIDIADLDDEAAHGWSARVTGKQATLLHRDATPLVLDGGRTIAGGERFQISVAPNVPLRLVLRTGGNRQYTDQDAVAEARLTVDGTPLVIPAPAQRGTLIDLELELPGGAGQRTISVDNDRPYRAFHWFVLQPD